MNRKRKCIPNNTDGLNNDVDIANMFARKFVYEQLFQSVPTSETDMKSLLSTIVERISTMGRGNNSDVIHIAEVTSAIDKLKRGKRDGTHCFFSDHIIQASAKMHVLLTDNSRILATTAAVQYCTNPKRQ